MPTAGLLAQIWGMSTDPGDPEAHVDGNEEPPRRGGEDGSEGDTQQRCAPEDGQEQNRLIRPEGQHRQGRIGPRGDEEDVCVVETAQDQPGPRPPPSPVVDGRGSEEQHSGDGEDRGSDPRLDRGGDDDQRQPAEHRQGKGGCVEPTTQFGLDLTSPVCPTHGAGRAPAGNVLGVAGTRLGSGCGVDCPLPVGAG